MNVNSLDKMTAEEIVKSIESFKRLIRKNEDETKLYAHGIKQWRG